MGRGGNRRTGLLQTLPPTPNQVGAWRNWRKGWLQHGYRWVQIVCSNIDMWCNTASGYLTLLLKFHLRGCYDFHTNDDFLTRNLPQAKLASMMTYLYQVGRWFSGDFPNSYQGECDSTAACNWETQAPLKMVSCTGCFLTDVKLRLCNKNETLYNLYLEAAF